MRALYLVRIGVTGVRRDFIRANYCYPTENERFLRTGRLWSNRWSINKYVNVRLSLLKLCPHPRIYLHVDVAKK
jgi:hypothetical protein